MANKFKIGDKVVALSTSKSSSSQPRIKGKIYTVQHIQYCSKCGVQDINIGARSHHDMLECQCGSLTPSNGMGWTQSRFFAPVISDKAKEEAAAIEALLAELEICVN